jgi:hypothetical protein
MKVLRGSRTLSGGLPHPLNETVTPSRRRGGTLEVTNAEFINTIFTHLPEGAFAAVCSKEGDPDINGWFARRGDLEAEKLSPTANNYVNCSSFFLAGGEQFKARKEQSAEVCFFMLDDLGTKVPVSRLGSFQLSWLIETSPGNHQGGIILDQPLTVGTDAESILKAIIKADLCDPGAGGAQSRWARLPVGINGKAKYINEAGDPFRCRLIEWQPGRRYTPEEIVGKLGLELEAYSRASKSSLNATGLNSTDKIPEGRRNSTLVSLAGTMRRRGMSASEILPGLRAVNDARCVPPLEDDEVSQIAKSIGRYPPSEDHQAIVEGERRRAQREENVKIGRGSDVIPTTVIHTIESLLDRYVFIRDGSQVADVTCPQSLLKLADFRNATAGSKHKITKPDGETYTKPASQAWLEHAERLEADTLTFRAGADLMTTCPNGQNALNLWRPGPQLIAPENWEALASHFVYHVLWLWGDDGEAFLDWLAHIEQYPGVLPHYGWIHTSPVHGMGRNWISSVLARVWRGHVAASLDLVGMLEGRFNDRLSRCLLAIIDEINEGGTQKYRHADTLRQLVTAEFREINPKYGRRHIEYNATRWLIFSNQTGALPLDEHDRRFWVVSHNGPVKPEGYYTQLYGMLSNPDFIASVVEFLRRRDISHFNPGKRPPMTDAKAELVSFSRTLDDEVCTDLVAHWPVDVITAAELNARLPGHEGVSRSAARYAMNRAGIRKLRKVRTSTCSIDMAYALRRYEQWVGLEARELKSEIGRFSASEKLSALSGGLDP